jgi:hypothetical protein
MFAQIVELIVAGNAFAATWLFAELEKAGMLKEGADVEAMRRAVVNEAVKVLKANLPGAE